MRAHVDTCPRHRGDEQKRRQPESASPEEKRQREGDGGRGMPGRERIVGVLEDQPLRIAAHTIPTLRRM